MPKQVPAGVRIVPIEEALQADVVMMLRVQKERMSVMEIQDFKAYRQLFGLTVNLGPTAETACHHHAPVAGQPGCRN